MLVKLPVLKMGHVLARRRPGCLMVLRVLPLCPAWCSKFLWKKRDVVLTVEWCVGWEVQFDEGDFLSFYLVEGQMAQDCAVQVVVTDVTEAEFDQEIKQLAAWVSGRVLRAQPAQLGRDWSSSPSATEGATVWAAKLALERQAKGDPQAVAALQMEIRQHSKERLLAQIRTGQMQRAKQEFADGSHFNQSLEGIQASNYQQFAKFQLMSQG
ncbi:hypothetical protein AK812_SmicGene643 [Symbiodinium microadriaticum]|uniref:Uncharacterized protein n=1 Tax=Symbiodinium microadriaticum TaxID=2951 RepID=A0A1Q9F6G2_SYMMI|nr:hypothetical protein AK812_SmicGene643 [Symbiodinium microadriaticum]